MVGPFTESNIIQGPHLTHLYIHEGIDTSGMLTQAPSEENKEEKKMSNE